VQALKMGALKSTFVQPGALKSTAETEKMAHLSLLMVGLLPESHWKKSWKQLKNTLSSPRNIQLYCRSRITLPETRKDKSAKSLTRYWVKPCTAHKKTTRKLTYALTTCARNLSPSIRRNIMCPVIKLRYRKSI